MLSELPSVCTEVLPWKDPSWRCRLVLPCLDCMGPPLPQPLCPSREESLGTLWKECGLWNQTEWIGVLAFFFFSLLVIMWSEVKVIQLCLTLWDAIDCSAPGSSLHGILQARVLECVAIPFSRGSSQPRDWTQVSHTAGWFFTCWATVPLGK